MDKPLSIRGKQRDAQYEKIVDDAAKGVGRTMQPAPEQVQNSVRGTTDLRDNPRRLENMRKGPPAEMLRARERENPSPGFKKGGMVKGRGDGCCQRGKTKGRMC